jgi:DNA-binding IclR family transcriptional regulator
VERKLSEIARQGYDAVPSDLLEGIVNMSYPVLDHGGRAIASLTVPFLHWKAAAETASREATREALGAAAARLSAQVGPAASAF